MSVRVEVVCVSADGTEQRRDVMAIERAELVMETLGMSLKEGKALLEGVQDLMVAHHVNEYLEQHRKCPSCGKRPSPRMPAARRSRRYLVRSTYQIRAGTGAPATLRVQIHSGPPICGCRGEPVRNCFTWRRNGLR